VVSPEFESRRSDQIFRQSPAVISTRTGTDVHGRPCRRDRPAGRTNPPTISTTRHTRHFRERGLTGAKSVMARVAPDEQRGSLEGCREGVRFQRRVTFFSPRNWPLFPRKYHPAVDAKNGSDFGAEKPDYRNHCPCPSPCPPRRPPQSSPVARRRGPVLPLGRRAEDRRRGECARDLVWVANERCDPDSPSR